MLATENEKYYARHQHDKIVYELLNKRKNGFFIDIGATDGITSNNSFKFEKDWGWNGICIEPNKPFYDKLIENRQCHCFNICVGSELQNGLVAFREDKGNGELSSISSFNDFSYFTPCLSLNKIVQSMNITNIDFLSIDTEGNELNIIKDIDFDNINIECICYEHNKHFGEMWLIKSLAIDNMLRQSGYEKVMDLDSDSIFIKKK